MLTQFVRWLSPVQLTRRAAQACFVRPTGATHFRRGNSSLALPKATQARVDHADGNDDDELRDGGCGVRRVGELQLRDPSIDTTSADTHSATGVGPMTADVVLYLYETEDFESASVPFVDGIRGLLQQAHDAGDHPAIQHMRETCDVAVSTLLGSMRAAPRRHQRRIHRVAYQVLRIMAADPSHWIPTVPSLGNDPEDAISSSSSSSCSSIQPSSPPISLHAFLAVAVAEFPPSSAVKIIGSAAKLGLMPAEDAEVRMRLQAFTW
jgi:hypothetical protein